MTGIRSLHCHLPSAFWPLLVISSLKYTKQTKSKHTSLVTCDFNDACDYTKCKCTILYCFNLNFVTSTFELDPDILNPKNTNNEDWFTCLTVRC